MRAELLRLAASLAERYEAFAIATVVRREAPSSARLGDAALVTRDGELHGWVGGSCTRSGVVREALEAIAARQPRLVAFDPEPAAAGRPGIVAAPMTCHSGGSLEIYVDPVVPPPRLLVYGTSPIARALVELGKAMRYRVGVAGPGAQELSTADEAWNEFEAAAAGAEQGEAARLIAVVATMGEGDERAVRAALAVRPDYLGVVASPRRFEELRDDLAASGIEEPALDEISSPAGIDIGARSSEEIALSILAEAVAQQRRAHEGDAVGASTGAADPARSRSGKGR